MVVFKYLEDKDVFQKFYSKMLANRLVSHMSASDEAESSMIGKLKHACGFEYTSKLQRMYQDIGLSKDLNDEFKQWMTTNEATAAAAGTATPSSTSSSSPSNLDFQIQVLSSGSWPFTQCVEFALPSEVGFQKFACFFSVFQFFRLILVIL